MPVRVQVGHVVREFALFVARGLKYWLSELVNPSRDTLDANPGFVAQDGVPIVVVNHGGGNNPEAFMEEWNFPQVWATPTPRPISDGTHPRRVDCQCVVVYMYGWSSRDERPIAEEEVVDPDGTLPPTATITVVPNTDFPEGQRDEIDAINENLAGLAAADQPIIDKLGEIDRDLVKLLKAIPQVRSATWNPGSFFPNDDPQDDVAFFDRVLQVVEAYLLEQVGIVWRADGTLQDHVIDRYRRYLFGYSNGAMMGFRLVKEMPSGTWAAFHAMCGTIGGKRYTRYDVPPLWDNYPVGIEPVSLYFHAGGRDVVGDPYDPKYEQASPDSNDLTWAAQVAEYNDHKVPPLAHDDRTELESSPEDLRILVGAYNVGGRDLVAIPRGRAAQIVQQYLPMNRAVAAYVDLFPLGAVSHFPRLPDRLHNRPGPRGPLNLPGDRDSRNAEMWIYEPRGRGLPAEPVPDPMAYAMDANPVVVEHRDERMNHTNYFSAPPAGRPTTTNRYITVHTIWRWFYAHPRVH